MLEYICAIAAAVAARFIYLIYKKNYVIPSQKGKTVWIIGASSGIGKAVAKDYYDNGANIIISSRREETLNEVKNEFSLNHKDVQNTITVLPLDIEKLDTFEDLLNKALVVSSHIDVLIISAGLGIRGLSLQTTQEVEDKVMNTNFRGPVALSKVFLQHNTNTDTTVVYISSVQGLLPVPARASYCAAKHALQAYTDSLRAEESYKHTHIMIVSPAYVKTNHSLSAVTGDGKPYGKMDKTTSKGMLPEELSKEIIYGVEHKQSHIISSPFWMKCAIVIRSICPSCLDIMLSIKAKKSIKQD